MGAGTLREVWGSAGRSGPKRALPKGKVSRLQRCPGSVAARSPAAQGFSSAPHSPSTAVRGGQRGGKAELSLFFCLDIFFSFPSFLSFSVRFSFPHLLFLSPPSPFSFPLPSCFFPFSPFHSVFSFPSPPFLLYSLFSPFYPFPFTFSSPFIFLFLSPPFLDILPPLRTTARPQRSSQCGVPPALGEGRGSPESFAAPRPQLTDSFPPPLDNIALSRIKWKKMYLQSQQYF